MIDTGSSPQGLDRCAVWDVSRDRVLEVAVPVQAVCAGDVSNAVEHRAFVDLEDDEFGVVEVLEQPVTADQHV